MRKIPTLFVRDENDRRYVTRDITPGCEWVLAGEGTATRKYDGTCVLFDGAAQSHSIFFPTVHWWARREVKPGKRPPENYRPVDYDELTGKSVGWEPVEQSPFAKFFLEAVGSLYGFTPGTYELVGPRINGNPERLDGHKLICHARVQPVEVDRLDFDNLRLQLIGMRVQGIEGIVWHHPDGRMAKLKGRDFG